MSQQMRDPAATAKARQRGMSVLDRLAEEQRIEEEKEEARRPRVVARRSQSVPRSRDKHGGEEARGRGRQRVNEAVTRKGGGPVALQQRSRSLVAKKNYRRSVVVSSVAPAGG
eukprot:2294903-Prymnesium_polylepis.1